MSQQPSSPHRATGSSSSGDPDRNPATGASDVGAPLDDMPLPVVYEPVPGAVAVLDPEYRLAYANDAAWSLFDVAPHDLGYNADGRPIDDPVQATTAFDPLRSRLDNDDVAFARLAVAVARPQAPSTVRLDLDDGTVAVVSAAPLQRDEETVGHLLVARRITEHVQVRRDLTTLESLCRQVVEALPVEIVLTDLQGRFQFVSPRVVPDDDLRASLLGKTTLETTRRRGGDLEAARRRHEALLRAAEGETVEFEGTFHRYPDEDETPRGTRHYSWYTTPIRQNGDITHVLGLGVDITAQKEKEQELRTLADLYEDIVALMPADLGLFDAEGRMLYVSPSAPDWLTERDDLIGHTLPEVSRKVFGSDDDLEPLSRAIETAIETGETVRYDAPSPSQNDDRHFLRIVRPSMENGEVKRVLAFRLDVTERHRIESKLRELTDLYQALIDNLPAQIGLFDDQGRVEFAPEVPPIQNEDWARENFVGLTMREVSERLFGSTERLERAAQAIDTVLDTGASVQYERPFLNLEGEERYYLRIFKPLFHDGAVKRVLSFGVDITERRRAEQELQQAKETAENALRAKEQFLSTITHELRTPLHAVLGLTDLLETTDLDDEQASYLEDIRFSSQSLLQLINDILDVSKMGEGRLELHVERFSPAVLVSQIVNTMKQRADDRGNEIHLDVDEELTRDLVGDPLRIKQILWNLLSNAIEATEDGEIHVRAQPSASPDAAPEPNDRAVPTSGAADDVCWLAMQVSDTGAGIPPADRDRVFESFVQLNTADPSSGGTGLGLAIVRHLVDLCGGTIDLDTRVREGSTFTVRLPLADPDAPEESGSERGAKASPGEAVAGEVASDEGTSSRQSPSAREARSSDDEDAEGEAASAGQDTTDRPRIEGLEGRTILIVEDTLSNQKLIRHLLTRAGAVVTATRRGEDALDLLRDRSFDGLIVDVQLPEMSGVEVARRARQDLGLHALPIVAVSAADLEARADELDAVGVDAHLSKPFEGAEIVGLLNRYTAPASRSSTPEAEAARDDEAQDDTPAPAADEWESASAEEAEGEATRVIDPAILSQQAEAYGADEAVVARVFLEEARQFETTLGEAEEVGDADRVRDACHALRTSAHLIGAEPLHRLLKAVDVRDRAVTAETILALRVHLRAARDAITRHLNGG